MIIEVFNSLRSEIKNLKYKFFQFSKIDLNNIKLIGNELISSHDSCIIIGFGASSLNIKVLASLQNVTNTRTYKKVTYLDNVDMAEVKTKLDIISTGDKTLIFAISRSGNTWETHFLTQYLLEIKGVSPKNMVIICPSTDNLLFNIHKKHKTRYFEHSEVESGRFGIISSASLLPAYFLGINIDRLIDISVTMLDDFVNQNSQLIVEEAKWYIGNFLSNKNILILWNYSYQLRDICLWQRQILAESLGKNGYGVTPVISYGSSDEHSQFQLYLDGPDDKFYKIIYVKSKNQNIYSEERMLKIYNIFKELKKPVKLELFEAFNEELVIFQIIKTLLTTILIAKNQNLNPLDQPAIEFIKTQLTV